MVGRAAVAKKTISQTRNISGGGEYLLPIIPPELPNENQYSGRWVFIIAVAYEDIFVNFGPGLCPGCIFHSMMERRSRWVMRGIIMDWRRGVCRGMMEPGAHGSFLMLLLHMRRREQLATHPPFPIAMTTAAGTGTAEGELDTTAHVPCTLMGNGDNMFPWKAYGSLIKRTEREPLHD